MAAGREAPAPREDVAPARLVVRVRGTLGALWGRGGLVGVVGGLRKRDDGGELCHR
jgi:hypothetical protein